MKPDHPKYLAPPPWGSPGGQSTGRSATATKSSTEILSVSQTDNEQDMEGLGQSGSFQALESEKNKFFATISILILLGIVLSAIGYDGVPRSSGAVISAIVGSLVLALSWLLVMAFVLYGTERWAKVCCKWGSEALCVVVLAGSLFSFNSVGLAWAALLAWQVSVLDKDLKYLS